MMRLLRTLWTVWRRFGHRVAVINGTIIMTLFYVLVVTPYAFLLRLLGRDLLECGWDRAATSYWKARRAHPPSPDTYARPF